MIVFVYAALLVAQRQPPPDYTDRERRGMPRASFNGRRGDRGTIRKHAPKREKVGGEERKGKTKNPLLPYLSFPVFCNELDIYFFPVNMQSLCAEE